MAKNRSYSLRPNNLGKEKNLINSTFTNASCTIKNGVLRACVELQPTALSRVYKVLICYKHFKTPKVYVLSPNIYELTKGLRPEHVYEFDEKRTQLCLYYPSNIEWDKSMFIAKTIIPWASLWLYYFEIWLATGKWQGGGIHPQ